MEEFDFKYYDLIESYMEGKLTPSQVQEFEARLTFDNDLKEELELYKIVVAGIRSKNEKENLKNKLTNLDSQMDSTANQPKQKNKNRNRILWIFGIAAFLLMLLFLLSQMDFV